MKVRQEKLIMGATENKELIRNMWAEASKGSVEGFLNGFADDVHYTIIGTTKFSGIFKGKQDLVSRAFMPLMSELERPGRMVTDNLTPKATMSSSRGAGLKARRELEGRD
jgi:ketosteroid isomerase-like protein